MTENKIKSARLSISSNTGSLYDWEAQAMKFQH